MYPATPARMINMIGWERILRNFLPLNWAFLNPGMEDLQTYVAEFVGDMAQVAYRMEFPTYFDILLLTAGITGKFEKSPSQYRSAAR